MGFRSSALFLILILTCAFGSGSPAQTTQPNLTECRRAADWCPQTLVGEYDKHAQRHPAWDEPARAALSAFARKFSDDPRQTGDEMDEIYFNAKLARDGGCRDPLVYFAAARNSREFQRNRDEWIAFHIAAAHAIEQTKYHPFWKCTVLFRTARHEADARNDPGSVADARRLFDAGVALVPQVLADNSIPRSLRIQLFKVMGDAGLALDGSREPVCARVFQIVDPQLDDRSLALGLMACFYVDHAWDARGSGYADSVSEEGWKQFYARLTIAAQAGEESWRLDRSNVRTAKTMMWAALGLQDDEQRRLWFNRAVQADPDDLRIYLHRLEALHPKWHGSAEAMIEFGRECLEKGNWDARIPFVLVEAHLTLSQETDKGYQRLPQPQYFRGQTEVWKDVKAVYDEYFKRPEPSMYHRSRFAEIAVWAGEYEEAAKQFEAMGDKFSYGWFWNDARYRRARAEVEAHVRAQR